MITTQACTNIKVDDRTKWELFKVHFKCFLSNLPSFHHRIMMRYLEKRGWVVFYLEPRYRDTCKDSNCFFNLYNKEELRKVDVVK